MRPQLSVALPNMKVCSVVPSVTVDLAAVHDPPPFHDNCTQNLGEPEVLSALPSRRTSMPFTVAVPGKLMLYV